MTNIQDRFRKFDIKQGYIYIFTNNITTLQGKKREGNCEKYFEKINSDEWVPDILGTDSLTNIHFMVTRRFEILF